MHTIATPGHSELIIKKSRFLGCVQATKDRATAQKIVAQLWEQHPGATHVCWALLAGGASAAVDDGEPSGTAGRPMLDVLRHQDLDGVLATVVRYYGGINLGAGGLVRAYTDCVAQALLNTVKTAIIKQRRLRCEVPYALEGLVRRELDQAGAVLDAIEHDQQVRFSFQVAEDAAANFVARLSDAGNGRIGWIDDEQ